MPEYPDLTVYVEALEKRIAGQPLEKLRIQSPSLLKSVAPPPTVVEGRPVRGIARMVAEDRYCIDVITQVQAVRAALQRVEEEVLKDHVEHCVEHAIASGDAAEQRQKVAELLQVLGRRSS